MKKLILLAIFLVALMIPTVLAATPLKSGDITNIVLGPGIDLKGGGFFVYDSPGSALGYLKTSYTDGGEPTSSQLKILIRCDTNPVCTSNVVIPANSYVDLYGTFDGVSSPVRVYLPSSTITPGGLSSWFWPSTDGSTYSTSALTTKLAPITCNNDGTCDSGETFSNCPGDCKCGNGLCDTGETSLTCPSDCKQKVVALPSNESYQNTFTFNIPSITSCDSISSIDSTKKVWETGVDCQYAYACYVIVGIDQQPTISSAAAKDCMPVSDKSGQQVSMTVNFKPPVLGKTYTATSFILIDDFKYDNTIVNGKPKGYVADSVIPGICKSTCTTAETKWKAYTTSYPSSTAILGLCPKGQVVGSRCYVAGDCVAECVYATPVCTEGGTSSLCLNVWTIYCLDWDGPGNGWDCTPDNIDSIGALSLNSPFTSQLVRANALCADGLTVMGDPSKRLYQPDGICDGVRDILSGCLDEDGDHMCDINQRIMGMTGCIDNVGNPVTGGPNGVCDYMDAGGISYCPTTYDPYCIEGKEYPNACIAREWGKDPASGIHDACNPSEWQCTEINAAHDPGAGQCPSVPGCDIAPKCINHKCNFETGAVCSSSYCTATSDCPAAPCVGVTAICRMDNLDAGHCAYEGSCIQKPDVQGLSIWSVIEESGLWQQLWTWIKNILSFIGCLVQGGC